MSGKVLVFLGVMAMAAFFGGCASLNVSQEFGGVHVEDGLEPDCAIVIDNSCWRLCGAIPLASGDPDLPNMNTCRAFRDTATLQNNLKMLDAEMARRNDVRMVNLTSRHTKESYLFFLLSRNSVRTSVILLKESEGKSVKGKGIKGK